MKAKAKSSSLLESAIKEAQAAYDKLPSKYQAIIDTQAATIPGKEHIFYATPAASFIWQDNRPPDFRQSNVIAIHDTPMGQALLEQHKKDRQRVVQPDDIPGNEKWQVGTRGGGESLGDLMWKAASLKFAQQAEGNAYMAAIGIADTAGPKVLPTVEMGVVTYLGKVTSINNVSTQEVRNFFSTYGENQQTAKVACEKLSILLPSQPNFSWMNTVSPGEKNPVTQQTSSLYQVNWTPWSSDSVKSSDNSNSSGSTGGGGSSWGSSPSSSNSWWNSTPSNNSSPAASGGGWGSSPASSNSWWNSTPSDNSPQPASGSGWGSSQASSNLWSNSTPTAPGFAGELFSFGRTAPTPFYQLHEAAQASVEAGWGWASPVVPSNACLRSSVTIPKNFSEVEPIIERIGKVPGGVVIDAQTLSLPTITTIELGSEEGSFIINSKWLFQSGLSAEECSILFHDICIEQEAVTRLGASSLSTVFGTEPDNVVGVTLRLIDARLGAIVFGKTEAFEGFTQTVHPEYRNPAYTNIQAVRALDPEAILSTAKSLSTEDTRYIFIRSTSVEFSFQDDCMNVAGISVELSPVCAPGDASSPDFKLGRGAERFKELAPFDYRAVEHLQHNFSSYMTTEPAFKHFAQYSAVASLFRKARKEGARFGDEALLREIYGNRLKQQYPENTDRLLRFPQESLYRQAYQDLLSTCESEKLSTELLASVISIGAAWSGACRDSKAYEAFAAHAQQIFFKPVDQRVPKSVISFLALAEYGGRFAPFSGSGLRIGSYSEEEIVSPSSSRDQFELVVATAKAKPRETGYALRRGELTELLSRATRMGSARNAAYFATLSIFSKGSMAGRDDRLFQDALAPFKHASFKPAILEGMAEALLGSMSVERAPDATRIWDQLLVEFFHLVPNQSVFLSMVQRLNHDTPHAKGTQHMALAALIRALEGTLKSHLGTPIVLKHKIGEDIVHWAKKLGAEASNSSAPSGALNSNSK